MPVGLMVGPERGRYATKVDRMRADAKWAEDAGLASVWIPQVPDDFDALTAVALVAEATDSIEIGTAVVPVQPRHPIALAQQALTAHLATGGRLTLGIGLSHKPTVENAFGASFERPARHMREYLAALLPLLRGEAAEVAGESVRARGQLGISSETPPPVLLAALAPRMLRLAGSQADGTITWMAGPKTVRAHIAPLLNEAAAAAGRPRPRLVVGLPVGVTDDVAGDRERLSRGLSRYGTLPSYRAMLDKEGVADPADVAVLGDEASVREQLEELAAAGATDLMATEVGSRENRPRTRALLRELVEAPV